jgi:hypothetical protein
MNNGEDQQLGLLPLGTPEIIGILNHTGEKFSCSLGKGEVVAARNPNAHPAYTRQSYDYLANTQGGSSPERTHETGHSPVTNNRLGWITTDKTMIPVCEMDDSHLCNTIMKLRTRIMGVKLATGVTALSVLNLIYLEEEARARGLDMEFSSSSEDGEAVRKLINSRAC